MLSAPHSIKLTESQLLYAKHILDTSLEENKSEYLRNLVKTNNSKQRRGNSICEFGISLPRARVERIEAAKGYMTRGKFIEWAVDRLLHDVEKGAVKGQGLLATRPNSSEPVEDVLDS